MSNFRGSPQARLLAAIGCFAIGASGVLWLNRDEPADDIPPPPPVRADPRIQVSGNVYNWWDPLTENVLATSVASEVHDNIAPASYSGPEACQKCHRKNFDAWSRHPHRWMNALADEQSVKGDFSGDAEISYLGGSARFSRDGTGYRMTLQRDGVRREYSVTQTIGSRFFQYYVGKGVSGPEPEGHDFYGVDHVLPFGYWLDRNEWIPTVHVHWVQHGGDRIDEEDVPSHERPDPFAARDGSIGFTPYYLCSQCHSTYALGDLLMRNAEVVGRHAPRMMHLAMADYLDAAYPQLWSADTEPGQLSGDDLTGLLQGIRNWEAPDHATSLGITCEACHLGCKEHAEGRQKLPPFSPQSPHLFVESTSGGLPDSSRNHENVNWVCGRCHTGNRRLLAGGMATWNSTEYTDAMRGSCYSQLKCIDCHNPHEPTGSEWSKPLVEVDQVCLQCHGGYASPAALEQHTHHSATGAGSRCVNCHMPRINEGLQDVVRTHMIYSPTEPTMLRHRHPNACNLCHVGETDKWAINHMGEWYASPLPSLDGEADEPAGLVWLRHADQSVRLLGADAISRAEAHWALPQLLDALDDTYLLNRQFARIAVERLMGVRLTDFGYEFFMTDEERVAPLRELRERLLQKKQVP